MSFDMASTSLRRFSACFVVSDWTSSSSRQLGDAVDQLGDLVAEQPVDLVARGVGVLDAFVQQAGRRSSRVSSRISVRMPATSTGWEK